jgi:hypothetical protein
MESFLKSEHAPGATFEAALKAALDAWSIGHMALQKDDAKELPERTAIAKHRQEQLATTGVEAAILERDAKVAIRYRALSDKEARALIGD